jgi:hypothetical protein
VKYAQLRFILAINGTLVAQVIRLGIAYMVGTLCKKYWKWLCWPHLAEYDFSTSRRNTTDLVMLMPYFRLYSSMHHYVQSKVCGNGIKVGFDSHRCLRRNMEFSR